MDALAEKITLRLGAGTFEGGGAAPASQGMRGATLAPDLPSFAEPEARVDATRVPPALLPASSARAQTEAAASTLATVSDVNMFTQEKMYFESYVRLLVKPEQVAAQRHAVPYPGEMLAPDISLITMGSKPNMAMPPKAPEFDESGNMIEDEDNFDEFERNNAVAFSFVRHNRYEPIESLMQQDTDVLGVTDPMGNTLLHVACQNNNRRIVKLLVKHGVRLDAQNNSGNTALHYCIQYGFVQLADFLMAHGADDSIANAAGYLPAQGLGKDSGVEAAQAGLRAGGAA
ncbi:unnamed protein product [Prorocentrum cordatum]|uniref:Uncharacterized protein n=1 Tax=Prorocentrum cordatum TaxID=2364126 RepID=A0ABN9U6D7_9DINO|nr:unnamed protein product [Polarella glacialis]